MKLKDVAMRVLKEDEVLVDKIREIKGLLEDIDIIATGEDYDIPDQILRKLSKKYKVDLKAKTPKPKAKDDRNIFIFRPKGIDRPKQEEKKAPLKDAVKPQAKSMPAGNAPLKGASKPQAKSVPEENAHLKGEAKLVAEKAPLKSTAKPITDKAPFKGASKPLKEDAKKALKEEAKVVKNQPLKKEKAGSASKPSFAPEELELSRVYDDKYSEFEEDKNQFRRIRNVKKTKAKSVTNRKANLPKEKKEGEKILYYKEGMTVANVADGIGVSIREVVKKLVMLGIMASASDAVERDVAEIIAEDHGFRTEDYISSDITQFENIEIEDKPEDLCERPPIVTIMGHVDHGKTTLLDYIRNAKVAGSEAGGITQHIGAYQVDVRGKKITFIDTPGHAAFTEMRARGANITDIVILVVAADDGVMPQTIEALEHAKAAKVPIIVAINKMDKPGANPLRIKEDLAKYDLLAEEWGGKTIFAPISALTGKGVDDLLEMTLLVAEMNEYKANPNRLGLGRVIEAKLDKGKGPVATLLVKNGSLNIGDPVVVGHTWGKIRAMEDEHGKKLKTALPSKAAEITGLAEVPQAGDSFMVFEDEKSARLIAEARKLKSDMETNFGANVSLSSVFKDTDANIKDLNLIIKADVQGSIEALRSSLEKLSVEGIRISIIRSGVGAVTETDISLAVASSSVIIAFNLKPSQIINDIAKEKHIEIRQYNVIYRLLDDIESAMKGMLDPVYEEKTIGNLEVRQVYKVSHIGTIAGCYVLSGYVERGCLVRLLREGKVICSAKLASLKHYQDDVKTVKVGFECGLTVENHNDIKVGDIIETYVMERVSE